MSPTIGHRCEETISLRRNSTELRQFKVLGTFGLNRITDTANYAP